jgi:hypothetical protein
MSTDIPTALRRLVVEWAGGCCEYCRISQSVSAFTHEPDYIIPVQHGGKTELENLALACLRCNRHKGPNVGSFDPDTGVLVQFFNPRLQEWQAHFQLEGATIVPLTPEGRVTAKILNLDDERRLEERERLIRLGLYP